MNIKKHIGVWLAFVIGGTLVITLKILLFPAVQVPAQRSEYAADPQTSQIDDCVLKYQKQAKSERASFIINWVCKCKSNGVVTLGGEKDVCTDYSASALDCFLKNIGDAQTNTAATAILRSCKEKYPTQRAFAWEKEWGEILKEKGFKAQPLEVKKEVAENFFQRRIATESEYQRLEPHDQERVRANFMRTIED